MSKTLDFSALMNLEVAVPDKPIVKRASSKVDIQGDFRITKSGHIYYSEPFKFMIGESKTVTLEDGTTKQEQVFRYLDVIDGTKVKWAGDKQANFMFIAIQPIGTAKASIQGGEGKVAFIDKWFKQIANFCYAVNWEVEPFIDFTLLTDKAIDFKIFSVPRTNKKGEPDYVRRENIKMYPCVPTSMIPQEPVAVQQELPFSEPVETVNESIVIE